MDKPFSDWDLRNLKVDDDRLEALRSSYHDLAVSEARGAVAPAFSAARRLSDAQHAVLFDELQRHRDRLCRECEGRTYVPNPEARYEMDRDTGNYETNDPEEIECPRCNGVGYEPPERQRPTPHVAPEREDGMPF